MQSTLINSLIEGEVPFVLIGGMAAVAHGSSLMTRDLDICVPLEADTFLRIQSVLTPYNPRVRAESGWIPLNLAPETAKRLKNLYVVTDLGKLDCLGEVTGIGDYHAVLSDSIEIQLGGRPCRTLSLDGLIRSKEAMGRPRDLLAVTELRALREASRGDE